MDGNDARIPSCCIRRIVKEPRRRCRSESLCLTCFALGSHLVCAFQTSKSSTKAGQRSSKNKQAAQAKTETRKMTLVGSVLIHPAGLQTVVRDFDVAAETDLLII